MNNNIKDIKRIIQRFQKKKYVEDIDFQNFLEEFGARLKGELLQYFNEDKNDKTGVWQQLTQEELKGVAWQDNYKKYIKRIPAVAGKIK